MLSDDSSSDSETGRFKGRSKEQEDPSSKKREGNSRDVGRGRHSDNDRFRRDLDRRKDDRLRFDRYPKDRHSRYSKHSPVRRRHSRERSPNKRPRDPRESRRNSRGRSKAKDHSRDRQKHSGSGSHKSPEQKRDIKAEVRRNIAPREKSPKKPDRKSREKSSSPELKGKRSVIHKPPNRKEQKKISDSPKVVEEQGNSDASEEVQPGSYYSMIPTVVKEKTDESSEIDSSDDEKLRAKLLNLEKELSKTKKKKHKRKHKRKSSKSKEKDSDTSALVEVSSTTDIQDKVNIDLTTSQAESAEVTSTQKNIQKESSEEGEISSDDDSQINMDPSDLRHKLRGSKHDSNDTQKSKMDVCGPALPPHLEPQFGESLSPDIEGPALPPHLQRKTNIGPAIPDNLRKVLADRTVVCESSDEDTGIGPLPAGAEDKWSEAHQRLEERALDIKIKKLDGHSLQDGKVKSREQWMLELPEGKAKYLGLEARSFRAKEGPDMSDRSSWTDTPDEKARKAAGQVKEEDAETVLKREAHARLINKRDEEQETAAKKHKKKHKREESLLDMHEKKLKKKKKKDEKEDGKKERRPFSRDVDLQANRFDEAQKKSIIKKSQELNTRFSRGEAKYL